MVTSPFLARVNSLVLSLNIDSSSDPNRDAGISRRRWQSQREPIIVQVILCSFLVVLRQYQGNGRFLMFLNRQRGRAHGSRDDAVRIRSGKVKR